MNKKILIIACLVIITTALSGCSLLGGDKNKETTKEESVKTEQKQEDKKNDNNDNEDGNYFETMTDLMARGKSMKCTYKQEIDGGGTANGVVYMADKNARTEITVKEDNHTAEMYAIINHEWTYSWTKGSSKGYKMTLESSEMGEQNEKTVANMAKDIDFKCKSWRKDNSKFKVPANIDFEDMSEMMAGFKDVDLEQTIKDAEAQANKLICDLCKNAPASEMAECLGDVICDWSK